VADIRDTTITGSIFNSGSFNGGSGIFARLRSTFRIRGNSDVSDNAGDGIFLDTGSAAEISSSGGGLASVDGNGRFGLNCSGSEASFVGDTSGIGPNTNGAINETCTGF
jgi:hypothetical protein